MRVKVIGPRLVGGASLGEHVELDLPEANIAALVRSGHVELAPEHVCDECGRDFASAGGLTTHQRSHGED